MLRTLVCGAALIAASFVLAGCGGSPPVTVRGEVTFDGTPIEEGSISFLPDAGTDSRKTAAAIRNGAYAISAEHAPTPGKFKIEITWSKKTGRKIPSADPGMTIDETAEAIPARYNSATTLIRDIVAGDNRLNFALDP